MRCRSSSILAVSLVLAAQVIPAQELSVDRSNGKIVMSRIAILPDSMSSGDRYFHPICFGVDSRQRYYEGRLTDSRIAIFDSSGHVIADIGGTGRGPQEFYLDGALVGPGDTLHIFQADGSQKLYSPT